jgi:predicted AlkP superfamily phosphohydrolase/phosphomutase
VPDPSGRGHRIVRPRESFRDVRGAAPDLLVFFGDLALRSLGRVGAAEIVVGPEEVERGEGRGGCNHDWDGLYVAAGPDWPREGEVRRDLANLLAAFIPSRTA